MGRATNRRFSAEWFTPSLSLASCACLIIAVVSGCGDDGNGGRATTATPTVVPQSPTATPILPPAGTGLSSTIVAVEIDASGAIAVTFDLVDDRGIPIEPVLSSTQSDQEARVRFTIAHVEEYGGGGDLNPTFTRYVNDVNRTQPGYDGDGVLETIDSRQGIHRYTFGTLLPEGFSPAETYTAGMQVDRDFEGARFAANPVFDIVPAGGDPAIRQGSTTETCNGCHDPLRFHGRREEFRLCTLCHTEGFVGGEGQSVDMRALIHRIHAGQDLPSGSDPDGVVYPRPLEDCVSCHRDGATADLYKEAPAAVPCTGCHDDVNPSEEETDVGPPGTGHFGRGFPDGDCRFCHVPDTGTEFDISVVGAHVIPERSSQLKGVNVEIVGVSAAGAGEAPSVSFTVKDDAGTSIDDLSGFNRLAFAFAGPTTDYESVFGVTAVGGGSSGMLEGPSAEGIFAYTPDSALPDDAQGTWSVGIEARRSVDLATGQGGVVSVNEAAANPVVTFNVDDSEPLARRQIVADENCWACHGELSRGFSVHGNLRNRVDYCVLCHNPNESDFGRRRNDPEQVAAGASNATIDFKAMIHKIHSGADLANPPYIVYGFGPTPPGFTAHDFSHVLYPGDRRNCAACHVGDSYLLPPFPGDALPTLQTSLDPADGSEMVDGETGPITSVCTSCHDSDAAAAHAATQTSPDGDEACSVCHMEGRSVAVSEAHAR